MASPRVGEEGSLVDVAVLSASDAWAVGSYHGTDGLQYSLSEHWDGVKWTAIASPKPSTPLTSSWLTGVSGTSPSDVWAIGSTTSPNQTGPVLGGPFVQHWNGTTWSLVSLPTMPQTNASFNAITAITPTDVWIAASANNTATFVHWNGSAWSVVAIPAVGSSSADVRLNAMTGLASNNVWAVGSLNGVPLILHYDGKAWSNSPSDPAFQRSVGDDSLISVSAAAADNVWAIGAGFSVPQGCGVPPGQVIEHWNGHAWSLVTLPANVAAGNNLGLSRVLAQAANDVWIMGEKTTGQVGYSWQTTPVLLHWNGAQWSTVAHPFGASGLGNIAAKSGVIWAVGAADPGVTLTGRWDGSQWSRVASPNPGTLSNELHAVTAITPTDVWAVGRSDGGTLAEHWNGTQWSVTQTVNDAVADNALTAVAGTSAKDVWAVGARGGSIQQDLASIQHWDGSTWRSVAPANGGALYGVAALSATDAWAVGVSGAQHWDGATWKASSDATATLYDIAAVATNDVWAVGGAPPGGGCGNESTAIIMHWNGARWSTKLTLPSSTLNSISAVSGTDIWAAGDVSGFATLMHWDGKQWSQLKPPGQSDTLHLELGKVSARASNDVWVACNLGTLKGPGVLHWDGVTWTVIPLQGPNNLSSFENHIDGIAAVSAGEVWAVGQFTVAYGRPQAWIERFIA